MIGSTYLETATASLNDLINRARFDGAHLSSTQLNWKPSEDQWSIGQIFEHMHLATAPYLQPMTEAIENAPFDRKGEVRHSWIGKLIIKAAGPDSNAPAPKQLIPGSGPHNGTVIEKFVADYQRLAELAGLAAESDLVRTTIRNPFISLIRMNMADCFAVQISHAERHLGQIEALKRHPGFPAA